MHDRWTPLVKALVNIAFFGGALAVVSLPVACASSPASEGPPDARPANAPRRLPNLITADELATTNAANLYDAVQRLRPTFLALHGAASPTGADEGVVVYLGSTKLGATTNMQSISIQEVKEVQYLNSGEATQRFGTGHSHGAIIVIRK